MGTLSAYSGSSIMELMVSKPRIILIHYQSADTVNFTFVYTLYAQFH
jgi:hypothetical protein